MSTPRVAWGRLDGADARVEWTRITRLATDANPVQAWAWGEYKRALGWKPERWIAADEDGAPVAAVQILERRLPLGVRLVWAPGGPLTGFPASRRDLIGDCIAGWLSECRSERRLVYARFSLHAHADRRAEASVARVCARSQATLASGLTVQIDLRPSIDALRTAMTSKHRYYVKRSEAVGLEWKWGVSESLVRDFTSLYDEMADVKQLERGGDAAHVPALCQAFGSDGLVLIGYEDGRPATGCLVLMSGTRAFYLLAATGAAGRRHSAAYAMIAQLFGVLKSLGVERFDFGGLAPGSPGAAGVDHFKRGFGGDTIEYLGEWEWARSRMIQRAANYLIGRRRTW